MAKMIPRHLAPVLLNAAQSYPAVSLTGPRQSGKTTLAQAAFPDYAYASLETPEHREHALQDPRGFLGRFPERVILDEVQRCPDLFSYIQGIVDERKRPGQFLLTGSHNFLLLEQISQTLAGRCAMLHLLPFSRAELCRRPMGDLSRLGRTCPDRAATGDPGDLFETLFTGGYPRIHDLNIEPQDWLRNYYQAYVERDVRSVLNVGDLDAFGRFVRLCAGRVGHLLNLSSLAADCGISQPTARRWMSILEASFLVMRLRPHYRNFSKRLIKSPKLYFLDTGLLCYLLRIRSPQELATHALRGEVFESWAVSEIVKNYHHRGVDPDVYFWRDAAGHEIDLVLDRGRDLVAVEIKSGQTFASDFLRGLEYWRGLPGQADPPTVCLYGGDASYVRGGATVLSWRHWG